MPDAQLTMNKLWDAKEDGSLTNKLKQYPLVFLAFNHTAHKFWKLPTDIKTMEKNTNLATHKTERNFLSTPTRIDGFKSEILDQFPVPNLCKVEDESVTIF